MVGARPCCFSTTIVKSISKNFVFSFRRLPILLNTNQSTVKALRNRKLISRFYKRAGTTNSWACIRGLRRLQQRSGYSNLLQHWEQTHKEEVNAVREQGFFAQQAVLLSLIYSNNIRTVNGWTKLEMK